MPFRFPRWIGGDRGTPVSPPAADVRSEGWPSRTLGLDLGAHSLKVSDGERDHVLPRVIGEDLGGRFQAPLSLGGPELSVTVNDRTFLLGEAAIRHSPLASRSQPVSPLADPHLPVLVLGALAPFAAWSEQSFQLVTGLSMNRYRTDGDALAEQLRGDFVLELPNGTEGHNGRRVRRSVRVGGIRVIPKAMGAFYDAVLNAIGNLERSTLCDQAVGVVDIGYRSTELVVAHRLEFIDSHAATLDTGLGAAHDAIARRLRVALGITKSTHELDAAIQRGALRLAGSDHDLRPVAREVLALVAETLAAQIDSVWDYRELDVILLAGGGSVPLGPYIQARYPNARTVPMPLLANARGFAKLGRMAFCPATGFQFSASNGRG